MALSQILVIIKSKTENNSAYLFKTFNNHNLFAIFWVCKSNTFFKCIPSVMWVHFPTLPFLSLTFSFLLSFLVYSGVEKFSIFLLYELKHGEIFYISGNRLLLSCSVLGSMLWTGQKQSLYSWCSDFCGGLFYMHPPFLPCAKLKAAPGIPLDLFALKATLTVTVILN